MPATALTDADIAKADNGGALSDSDVAAHEHTQPRTTLDWSHVVSNLPHSAMQFIEGTIHNPSDQAPDVKPSGRFSKAHPDFADRLPMIASAADSVEELVHNVRHPVDYFEKDPVGAVNTFGQLARGLLGSAFERGGPPPSGPANASAASPANSPPTPIPAGVKDAIGLVSPRARYLANVIDRIRGARSAEATPGAAAAPVAGEAPIPEIYDGIAHAMGQGKYKGLSAPAQQSIRDMAARLDQPPSAEWAPKPNSNAAPVEWQTPSEKAAAATPTPQVQPAPPASPTPAAVSPQPETSAAAPKSNVVTIPFSEPDLPAEAYAGSARAQKAQALAYYLHEAEGIAPADAVKFTEPERAQYLKSTAEAVRAGGGKAPNTWFDGKVSPADWSQAMVELKKLHGRAIVQAAQQRLGRMPAQARGPAQALSDALNGGQPSQ